MSAPERERLIETLPSGLRVAVERLPHVQSAAFTVLVPLGSAHDPEALTGRAALLCEMMPRGAGGRDARALTEAMDSLGMERDVDHGTDQLTVSGSLLARDLDAGLELARDIVLDPMLASDELEAAREGCLLELAGIEDNPSEKLFVELRRRYFPHPWGQPLKGDPEGLAALTLDDLKSTAARFPVDGAIVAVAGRVEPAQVRDRVAALFERWHRVDPLAEPISTTAEPLPAHVARDSGAQVQIGLAWPGTPLDHPDYPKAALVSTILSGGMSGRLFVEVREKRGLVYSVHAWHVTRRGRGDYFVYAGTTPDRARECLDVLRGELEGLKNGVTAEELAKAKTQARSSFVMRFESTHARADAMAGQLHEIGRVRSPEEVLGALAAVEADELNAWLKTFSLEGLCTLTLGPSWPGLEESGATAEVKS